MLYAEEQKLNHKHIPSFQTDEFLPPVSRWTSIAGLSVVATVGASIGIASYAQYNVTVKTAATVRPTGDIRLVQPDMEGSIKNIFVRENQFVRQGDAIARLDQTQLRIKKSQLLGNILLTRLQVNQIDEQIKALDAQIAAEMQVQQRTISSAQADFERNQREYQDRKVNTNTELLAAEANLEKADTDLQAAKADLGFAIKESERYQQLVSDGAVSQRELDAKKLSVEKAKSAAEAQKKSIEIAKAKLESAQAAINPSGATVAIAKERIASENAKSQATLATLNREKQALIQRRVELQNQIGQYQREVEQSQNLLQNSVIRATSDGTILKLNLRNTGQVVRSGEAIAQILPENAPLVMKAMIPRTEIRKVAVGQKVQLRVDACPYPDYGTLKGVVREVSPDAITSQSNNTNADAPGSANASSTYFEATIEPEMLSFGNNNSKCRIQPGMDAKADIISKKETALQFMLRKARLITDL